MVRDSVGTSLWFHSATYMKSSRVGDAKQVNALQNASCSSDCHYNKMVCYLNTKQFLEESGLILLNCKGYAQYLEQH